MKTTSGISLKTKNSISVIVPVYNDCENVIGFMVDILKQSEVPEVIFAIYQDNPADLTEKTINAFKDSSNIKLVKLNRRGTGIAINEAFKVSTGNYILVANADYRFKSNQVFSELENIISEKMDVIKVMHTLEPRPDLSIIQNCIRLWDVRTSGYASFTLVKREIFPEYPDISYGEDKIAWLKINKRNPIRFQIIRDYGFERGNYKRFGLIRFIRRYVWYGSTYKQYAKEAAKLGGWPGQRSYLPFMVLKPFLAIIAFVSMKVGRLR